MINDKVHGEATSEYSDPRIAYIVCNTYIRWGGLGMGGGEYGWGHPMPSKHDTRTCTRSKLLT